MLFSLNISKETKTNIAERQSKKMLPIIIKSAVRISAELKGAYWISSNSSFIQYCDSNIGLFSIAPPLVIALPTLR
jgi:hypothetical protein